MKRTQLKGLFAVAAIFASCVALVNADPPLVALPGQCTTPAPPNQCTTPPPPCSSLPTLGKLMEDILTQGTEGSSKLRPNVVNAPKDKLTPAEADELEAILIQSLNFYKNQLPCVVNKLNSNSQLTPDQIQQVQDVVAQRVTMLTATKYLLDSIGGKLNFDQSQKKSVIDISKAGIEMYREILGVVENTNKQPTLSAEKVAQITRLIADSGTAIDSAVKAFEAGPSCVIVPTTTTPRPTTRTPTTPSPPAPCSSSVTLGKLMDDILTQGTEGYSKLRPNVVNAPKDKLTPAEADELEAILIQSLNFYKNQLPCVVNKLNSNSQLTPDQIQQIQDVVAQRVTMLTASKYLLDSIGGKLNFDQSQKKSVIDISKAGIEMYREILGVVENTSEQPTLSAEKAAQITRLIDASGTAINTAVNAFEAGPSCVNVPTTTTTTTPPPTTTTPSQCTTPPAPCSSGPTLGKLVDNILTQGTEGFSKLSPNVVNAPKDKLTPAEVQELESILAQSLNFYTNQLPSVANKLNSEAQLTPDQIQQIQDVLAHRVTMLTATKNLLGNIGSKLNFDCGQQTSVIEISTAGIDMYREILGVVGNTSQQPTLSAEQISKITRLIDASGTAINSAVKAFEAGPSCTNSPPPPSTTTTTAPHVCCI